MMKRYLASNLNVGWFVFGTLDKYRRLVEYNIISFTKPTFFSCQTYREYLFPVSIFVFEFIITTHYITTIEPVYSFLYIYIIHSICLYASPVSPVQNILYMRINDSTSDDKAP
jgi:hypothetical protein